VYADALEEAGRTLEAEYLRAQCQQAELVARLASLTPRLTADWVAQVGSPAHDSEFTLASGRAVRLQALRQWRTYEGLREGAPTREHNEGLVQRVLQQESRPGEPAALLQPVERALALQGYPFGTPAALPSVCCVGRLESVQPARDLSLDGSSLVVVWFQDDFAFPIEPAARMRLTALDWVNLAHDYEF
jgi:hypothetical protein